MIIGAHDGDAHSVLGTTAVVKLDGRQSAGHLAVVEHTVPLHAGPPPHVHDHEDELLYVLAGTFDFILGDPDTWHPAETGTIVHVPAGTLHTSRATSDGARLLSLYTPPGGEEFFRQMDSVDQRDLPAVMELAQRCDMSFPAAPARP